MLNGFVCSMSSMIVQSDELGHNSRGLWWLRGLSHHPRVLIGGDLCRDVCAMGRDK